MVKRLLLNFLLVISFLFISVQSVFAAEFNTILKTHFENVKDGDTVSVILELNLKNAEEGAFVYKGTLDYDKNVFYEVKQEDFECLNSWEKVLYNDKNQEFILINIDGSRNSEEFLKVNLKVKNSKNIKHTSISIKNALISEGIEDIEAEEDTNIIINVDKEDNEISNDKDSIQGDQSKNPESSTIGNDNGEKNEISDDKGLTQGSVNNQSENPESSITANNSNENDKEKDDNLIDDINNPDGEISNAKIIILIVIFVLLILLMIYIIWRIKGKKEKFKNKNLLLIFITITLIAIQGSLIVNAIEIKGELTGDGIIDYEDVILLQKHLIGLDNIKQDKLNNADLDYNKRINITDLVLLLKKVEKRIEYKVDISTADFNVYPKKNEIIDYKFNAEVSNNALIETITINDKEYLVEYDKANKIYIVKIDVGNNVGVQKLKISKVKLDVGEEVKVKHEEKIDVLKDMPIITDYEVGDITYDNTANISFVVNDYDESMISGEIVISDDKKEVIKKQEIISGKNSLDISVEENKLYNVSLNILYDLDSNTLSQDENSDYLVINKELQFNPEYNFKFSDLKLYDSNGNENNYFNKDDEIILGFNSSNDSKYNPEYVIINEKEYSVNKDGEVYKVNIGSLTNIGNNKITITKLRLSNGKTFDVNKDIDIVIRKKVPEIIDMNISENNNNLKISFNTNDEDNAIDEIKLIIKDKEGNEIFNKIVNKSFNEEIEVKQLSNMYTIEVLGNYTLSDKDIVVDKLLYTEEFKPKTNVKITSINTNKEKFEKGEVLEAVYTIETTSTESIKKLQINNAEYFVKELENNKYRVIVALDDKAGIKNISLQKVIFDDEVLEVDYNTNVEILKDAPKINNFTYTENVNDKKVNFIFNIGDKDSSLKSGKMILKRKDGAKVEKEIISTNNLSFDFDVKEEEYKVEIYFDYARDINGQNSFQNQLVLSQSMELLVDYNLNINNLKIVGLTNKEAKNYFKADENVGLEFESTNNSKYKPEKIIINNKEFKVVEVNNKFYSNIGTYNKGTQNITIDKVIMDNGKEIEVTANNYTSFEILKEAPTISDLKYTIEGVDKVLLTFNVNDDDDVLEGANITINDGNTDVVSNKPIHKGNNEVEFDLNYEENYSVKIKATYDLDSNKDNDSNKFTNAEIHNEDIEIVQQLVEYKDIESVELYGRKNGKVEEINNLDVREFNPNNYIAKVNMRDLPSAYFEVEKGEVVGKDFILTLIQKDLVHYNSSNNQREDKLVVRFGGVKDNEVINLSLQELIDKIKKDPSGNYELTTNLDASNLTDKAMFNFKFTGTLDGNGYTIKNLNVPLFSSVDGATVKNLIIEKANVSGSNLGIIANTAIKSKFKNVHVKNSSISTWHSNYTGGFIGKAENTTIIEECSVSNIYAKSYKRVGGMVGYLTKDSIISNSYVSGTVAGRGDGIGGIVGQTEGNTTIENSYTDIKFDKEDGENAEGNGIGGIVGWSDKKNGVVLKNNISIAMGNTGYKITGTIHSTKSSNNYEIIESQLKANNDNNRIKTISKNNIDDNFFSNVLKWDKSIWNIENISADNLPKLNNLDKEEIVNGEKPSTDGVYIPALDRIKKLEDYDSTREIAYHNMYMLSPFIDAKYLVRDGNNISKERLLNTSKIKSIYAYDNGKVVMGLNTNTYKDIDKIKIVYENNEVEEYTITFDKRIGNVAKYTINNLNINYSFNKYILDLDINLAKELLNEIVSEAEKLDYEKISEVTVENESRLYVDYYNENIKNNLSNVILSLLQSEEDYSIYINNNILYDLVKSKLIDNNQLAKVLYTYNYFEKWYGFEIGGLKISDEILFNSDCKISQWVDETLNTSKENRETKNNVKFYDSLVKPKFGNVSLTDFLENYMITIAGERDGSEWLVNNFEGVIFQQPIPGKEDQVRYKVWDIMKARTHIILPVLSAPQEDMYLFSVPSQLIIGSSNRYNEYLTEGKDGMMKLIKPLAELLSNFYSVSSEFVNNSTELLNSKAHIQYDTRFNFPNGAPTPGEQEEGKTQDPVIKWVYEGIRAMAKKEPNSAYANGTDVYWVVFAALDPTSYSTFTHETSHNQDGYYFYENSSRRGGGEENTDGTTTQDVHDGTISFSLSRDYTYADDVSTNFTLDRIRSKEKIYSFYKEMFNVYYLLDYLTAQAFLELTPEEQSKLAVQAEHNQSNKAESTTYKKLTNEEFRSMKLKNVEDLWDNKIALRNEGVENNNRYGQGTHYDIYWYQPHNDNGIPDSRSLQRIGMEMLAYAGYSNGFVEYRSARTKGDLAALQKITKDPNMTFKQFKMDRYEEVQENLEEIPYFDADKAIAMYKKALEDDAKALEINPKAGRKNTDAVRRTLYGLVKRVTNDFDGSTIYKAGNVIDVKTAKELIAAIEANQSAYINILNDLDFNEISDTDGYYINKEFYGIINGNGNNIVGVNSTLFKKLSYSYIKDINILNPIYGFEDNSVLAETIKNSMFEGVKVTNANISIPMRVNLQGYEDFSNSKVTIMNNIIKTPEELMAIGNDEMSLRKNYELGSNIDLRNTNSGGESYISGVFAGVINGNGYTINNGTKPIFNNLKGEIQNLNIEAFNINSTNTSSLGALAKESNNALIENINLNNIDINGKELLGSLVGKSTNSTINKINASNIDIKGWHFYMGGLIGRSFSSNISDVYVQGKVKINKTHNGGVIGGMTTSTLKNAFANVEVTRVNVNDSRNKNGGLVGYIEGDVTKSSITNSINIGNVGNDIYKVFVSEDKDISMINKSLANIYEYEPASGISSIKKDQTDSKILTATEENIKNKEFYINSLNWSEEIWDFSNVTNGKNPNIKRKN